MKKNMHPTERALSDIRNHVSLIDGWLAYRKDGASLATAHEYERVYSNALLASIVCRFDIPARRG